MKNILLSFVFSVLIITNNNNLKANDDLERAGDILQIALPLYAITHTYIKDDDIGRSQFLKSYFSTLGTTYVLKVIVDEPRPGKDSGGMSFPSGHTASAFAPAHFMQKRYGKKYGIPFYLLAGLTGYSRIEAEKHHTHDVIASIFISYIFNEVFVTKYKNPNLDINLSTTKEETKLSFSMKF